MQVAATPPQTAANDQVDLSGTYVVTEVVTKRTSPTASGSTAGCSASSNKGYVIFVSKTSNY